MMLRSSCVGTFRDPLSSLDMRNLACGSSTGGTRQLVNAFLTSQIPNEPTAQDYCASEGHACGGGVAFYKVSAIFRNISNLFCIVVQIILYTFLKTRYITCS